MGYEITYKYHPRKDGNYDTETKLEKSTKVGKPFDDTPLEKCAAAILAQLARRDIWVVDVEIHELVKKKISFKESTDGKGIVLKNKKFSFNGTAEMVEETEEEPLNLPPGVYPHEVIQKPNESKMAHRPLINQNKVLYEVYFDPEIAYVDMAKRMNLKFTEDKKYPVHAVIPHPQGRLDLQKLVVTDDTGKAITVDEKFFVSAGRGLLADKELGFTNGNGREKKPKLMYEGELQVAEPILRPKAGHMSNISENSGNIPLDDGSDYMFDMPNIRGR